MSNRRIVAERSRSSGRLFLCTWIPWLDVESKLYAQTMFPSLARASKIRNVASRGLEHLLQVSTRVALRHMGHLSGWPSRDNLTTGMAAFRSHVDHPVGTFDDV